MTSAVSRPSPGVRRQLKGVSAKASSPAAAAIDHHDQAKQNADGDQGRQRRPERPVAPACELQLDQAADQKTLGAPKQVRRQE